MNALVVLAHPSPASFNHAIAEAVCGQLRDSGHGVRFHDLYREGFDPLLTAAELAKDGAVDPVVSAHCDELRASDALVFVHPNWWGQPPAVLTGWIDRVLRPNVAYRFLEGDCGEGVPEGLLRGRRALVINTTDTPRERELAVFGDPLERIWMKCVFDFCGIEDRHRAVFGVVVNSTDERRREWLAEARALTARLFPAGK